MKRVNDRAGLDALPDGAVVHDDTDIGPYNVWIKDTSMGWDDVVWWQGACDIPYTVADIPLPALVLYEVTE